MCGVKTDKAHTLTVYALNDLINQFVVYFIVVLTIGFIYAKRSNSSTSEYFLGGRKVGMEQHYSEWFEGNLPEEYQIIERFIEADELCYVIRRRV